MYTQNGISMYTQLPQNPFSFLYFRIWLTAPQAELYIVVTWTTAALAVDGVPSECDVKTDKPT